MAKRKLSRWSDVKPGDIISFKYNPKRKGELSKPHTVLVLNPRFPASYYRKVQRVQIHSCSGDGYGGSYFWSH